MTNQINHFQMKRATEKDTTEILTLLLNTAKWFQEKGFMQWNALLEGIDSHHTEEKILNGDVFVYRCDGIIAGMVMLLQSPSEWDEKLWGKLSMDDDVIYLHRIAINRKYANEGLGEKILKWAGQRNLFEGKHRIRLDCLAQNAFLNTYYENAGYTYLGEKNGYSLYERETSS